MNCLKKNRVSKYLIVGVDPGDTTGLAILNLKGELIFKTQLRKPSFPAVVQLISKMGNPLIIAVDKKNPSRVVYKVARILNSQIYAPKKDLSKEEKLEIFSEGLNSLKINKWGQHEKDAYTAARKAYKAYKNLLERIDIHSLEKKGKLYGDELKAAVLRGVSICNAIAKLEKGKTRKISIQRRGGKPKNLPLQDLELKLKAKEAEIERLRVENKNLVSEMNALKEKINTYLYQIEEFKKQRNQRISKDRELFIRDMKIKKLIENFKKVSKENISLKKTLRELKLLVQKLNEALNKKTIVFVPLIENLTLEKIHAVNERLPIKGFTMVYVKNPLVKDTDGVNFLRRTGVKAIISNHPSKKTETGKRRRFTILDANKLNLEPLKINNKTVGYIYERTKQEDLKTWFKKYIKKYREEKWRN